MDFLYLQEVFTLMLCFAGKGDYLSWTRVYKIFSKIGIIAISVIFVFQYAQQ